jgi:tRNA-dihydrouridine synthase 3
MRKIRANDVPVVKEAIDCTKKRLAITSAIQEQEREVARARREATAEPEAVAVNATIAEALIEERVEDGSAEAPLPETAKEEIPAKEMISPLVEPATFDPLLQERLTAQIEKLDRLNADLISTRLEPRSKRHISLAGKTYLAPLTTVGNLPFRRICKVCFIFLFFFELR